MQLRQHLISNGLISLVPMQAQHQDLFVELYSNKKIMRQIGEPLSPALAVSSFAKAISHDIEPRRHHYWVIQNAQGSECGVVALIMQTDNAAEVGVVLLPKFSRQGLALKASGSLLEYAFKNWQMDIIVASHKPANLPVPMILGKLSMQCITQAEDICWWQLKREDWQTLSGHVPYQCIAVEVEHYDN